MVDGAHKYFQDNRLSSDPDVVKEASVDYRDTNDRLSIFIRECLTRDPKETVLTNDVYERYTSWCVANGEG